LERKANQMLLKASQTLEHTGFALGSRRAAAGYNLNSVGVYKSRDFLKFRTESNKEDAVDEQEIESFFMEFTAMLRLMQSELRLMLGIIPLPHQKSVLSIILRDALELSFQEAESLNGRARRSVGRHDFGPVLLLFPALRHLVTLKADCDKLLEGCDSGVRNRFYSMVNSLHGTVMNRHVFQFVNSVSRRSFGSHSAEKPWRISPNRCDRNQLLPYLETELSTK
jgi:exocyst complex component 7